MLTVLFYLALAVVLGGVGYLLASYIFDHREEMAPPPQSPSRTRLPAYALTGADLRRVRFHTVLRGYRPADVDWVLEHTAAELDALRGDVAMLRSRLAERDASAGG